MKGVEHSGRKCTDSKVPRSHLTGQCLLQPSVLTQVPSVLTHHLCVQCGTLGGAPDSDLTSSSNLALSPKIPDDLTKPPGFVS